MSAIEIEIQATAEQLDRMEMQCDLQEHLMAATLAKRVEGLTPGEAMPFILSWFKSVRLMGQASFLGSGIKATVTRK